MSVQAVLRAKWVIPIASPPIEDGEVVVEDGLITEVRPAHGPLDNRWGRDFGHAALLPGLVNVHTHLDYTLLRGLIEDRPFFEWIQTLVRSSKDFTDSEWFASACWGAAEAIASGITTVGDCTPTGASARAARNFGLRGTIYHEVFGIDSTLSVKAIVADLAQNVEKLQAERKDSRLRIGISPHAPYTVRPALFKALGEWAMQKQLPLCIHVAESQSEVELVLEGRGEIVRRFVDRGIFWQPPKKSVIAYLDDMGVIGPQTLLVHGVHVSAQDCAIAAKRSAAWAHCPKSNAKLGNGVAPLALLSSGNPRVGLGSDSVVSNNTLDLFEEMRFAVLLQRSVRRQVGALTAEQALKMATLGGARALGMEAEVGTLEPGKRADLCAVKLAELHTLPFYDPYSSVVYAARASDVVMTMISGDVLYDAALGTELCQRFPGRDMRELQLALQDAMYHLQGRAWKKS